MFRHPARMLCTTLALAASVTLLSGCESSRWGFPYRSSVQQGNWITKDQVGLLRPGMTREQVRFALGTPMLTSALHNNRWDYPYYFREGNGKVEERVLTVLFDNNQLAKWTGDEQPDLQPFQLKKQGVGTSQREAKQLQIDQTRDRNDANLPAPINMLPGVTIDQTPSDPSLLEPPSTPNDTPKSLN
jgi:outer membrane protein assembly factor BamE